MSEKIKEDVKKAMGEHWTGVSPDSVAALSKALSLSEKIRDDVGTLMGGEVLKVEDLDLSKLGGTWKTTSKKEILGKHLKRLEKKYKKYDSIIEELEEL